MKIEEQIKKINLKKNAFYLIVEAFFTIIFLISSILLFNKNNIVAGVIFLIITIILLGVFIWNVTKILKNKIDISLELRNDFSKNLIYSDENVFVTNNNVLFIDDQSISLLNDIVFILIDNFNLVLFIRNDKVTNKIILKYDSNRINNIYGLFSNNCLNASILLEDGHLLFSTTGFFDKNSKIFYLFRNVRELILSKENEITINFYENINNSEGIKYTYLSNNDTIRSFSFFTKNCTYSQVYYSMSEYNN